MKIISELTDKKVLGTDGTANAQPRYTARAILKNADGLYAVMYAGKFNLYSLPGGGIEDNEDKITALKREIMEETGCECDSIEELGCVYENRAHCNYTQYSYYYIVTTKGATKVQKMTEEELKNVTVLQWHTFDEAVSLIKDVNHATNQQKFLQARDVAALEEYKLIKEGFINNCV